MKPKMLVRILKRRLIKHTTMSPTLRMRAVEQKQMTERELIRTAKLMIVKKFRRKFVKTTIVKIFLTKFLSMSPILKTRL